MINSSKQITICCCLIILFSSCKDDGVKGDNTITSIPYVVGTSNSYRWSTQIDSAGNFIQSISDSFTVKIESNTESFNGLNNLTLLEARRLSGTEVLQRVWYKMNNDSLTEIAYRFGPNMSGISIFPKRNSSIAFGSLMSLPRAINSVLATKTALDSIILRDDPRIVYKFPLSIGMRWISFHSPFLQTREVVGTEQVTVQSGVYSCLKIKSSFYISSTDSLVYYDYVTKEGLILRTFTSRLLYTTENNPEGLGVFVTLDERLEIIAHI